MLRIAAIAIAMATGALAPAQAQTWPAKTVRIIVPFGPGSTPDIVARLLGEQLQTKYPASAFVIENKTGASGNTGTDAVAKAAPDGTTIGVSIGGPLAINTLLFAKLPYDPQKDIAPITQLVTMPSALAVHPDLGVKSVADLIELLKKEPGKYNFGSIGNGSLSHLTMEAIAQKSGAQMVHIPYASSPAAMTALMRGDVHMAVLPAISVTPHSDLGKVTIIAVSLPKRSPYLSNIPTLKESGVDVEADTWMGLIAPGGTPPALVSAIHKDVTEALAARTVRDKLATQYMEPVGNSPAEFRAVIDAEIARWSPVIKAGNVKIN
ncbi:tripartite tricarboxylate transporter substrate binding protein [Pseudorhodoplanes sp.]|uniref:Bug family tripartite tricarboxylate transporter substrate binding protein n=1 Tax=Pseudorhodoplanes sp. TaxID=1934341 RepID=UPI002BAACEB4|nr:tripartite tricarboxylate transporter substrate binding protein [Pseudorhodoplanes sp.]HWV55036.1 tripartite tricarboxylate transporter substrate binding protein [Pseudorhodoplanes sp.]